MRNNVIGTIKLWSSFPVVRYLIFLYSCLLNVLFICDWFENGWNNWHIGILHVSKPQNVSRNRNCGSTRQLWGAKKKAILLFWYRILRRIPKKFFNYFWKTLNSFNVFKSIILDGSSECCYKILCLNGCHETAKYRDTTLERILKFIIECVSAIVSYENRRMNGIIYLTIYSLSRRSNDMHIVIRALLCETALRHASTQFRLPDKGSRQPKRQPRYLNIHADYLDNQIPCLTHRAK